MPATIQRLASLLNQSANVLMVFVNLLLVLLTAVYVRLTWRNLRALEQASLREREAQHLQQIKDTVIQPLVSWITLTVLGRFTGKAPGLLTLVEGYSGGPRRVSHTVDDPFATRQRLTTPADPDAPDPLATWTSTEAGRISRFLYDHTEQQHFPTELQEFGRLLEDVRQLTGAFVELANECARDTANIEVPPAARSEDENRMSEWANPHLLAVECIQSFLQGHKDPVFRLEPSGTSCVLKSQDNQPVARANQADKLKRWHELVYERVRARWQSSQMPQRTRDVLNSAETARRNIEGLLFTHSLGIDCELVSGRKRYR